MTVIARAARTRGAALEPYEYEPGPLGPREVDVRVTHCGVCHTDISLIDDEHGIARFPVVAGHEVVGTVEAVGTDVDTDRVRPGARVGVGATAGSCYACEYCLSGRQNFCADRDDTAFRSHRGGFADHVRASDWRHVQPIPDALGSAEAAPLLCAGATVFPPFLRHDVRPGDRVAVAGIGGLGHIAVQIAAAWGCDVSAVTSSSSKVRDARRLGASQVVTADELGTARDSFDLVISTASADVNWDDLLGALRPGGTLCVVGMPPSTISVSPFTLLPAERALVGGLVGAPHETTRMLEFCARHGVRPWVETFAVDRADEVLDRVRAGSLRYRAVLEF